MGEMVSFPGNGTHGEGYLAVIVAGTNSSVANGIAGNRCSTYINSN